jgi:TetR/AcrR family transcriptional regulator, tetracycline repressor protein
MATKKAPKRRRSARKRDARRGLTRERVVAEARRLLDAHGLEALSMRVLAQRLGVSTMALYNHVGGKQDLIQAIAQSVVQEFHIPSGDGHWRERLRACFRALRKVCLANPRSIPLIEQTEVLHPAVFRPMEITLAALQEAGIELQEAMQAYFLLTNFTMGQVSYEIRGPFRGLDPAEAVRRRMILPSDFPLVVKAASAGDWDFDAAFELGIDIIIEGLAARARAMRGASTTGDAG